LNKSIVKTKKTIDKSEKSIDKMEKTIDKFDKTIDKLKKSIDKLKKTVDKCKMSIEKRRKSIDKPLVLVDFLSFLTDFDLRRLMILISQRSSVQKPPADFNPKNQSQKPRAESLPPPPQFVSPSSILQPLACGSRPVAFYRLD
jgi:SMC interacting uncharacterized protein involved in chromosome segregation